MSWEIISFVNRSKNRKLILYKLTEPTTPTRLAKQLNLHRSVTSRSLIDLEKVGLIKCLNPQSKKERYYNLTKKGKLILASIKKMGSAN